MKQNFTTNMEKDLIKKAYRTAKEKALIHLEKGYFLGGKRVGRDLLHER